MRIISLGEDQMKYFGKKKKNISCDIYVHCSSVIEYQGCLYSTLALSTLWTKSADVKFMVFFLFFPRKHDLTFHANCLLETICMKCQVLFSGESKKYFKMSSAQLFTQHAKH